MYSYSTDYNKLFDHVMGHGLAYMRCSFPHEDDRHDYGVVLIHNGQIVIDTVSFSQRHSIEIDLMAKYEFIQTCTKMKLEWVETDL